MYTGNTQVNVYNPIEITLHKSFLVSRASQSWYFYIYWHNAKYITSPTGSLNTSSIILMSQWGELTCIGTKGTRPIDTIQKWHVLVLKVWCGFFLHQVVILWYNKITLHKARRAISEKIEISTNESCCILGKK